MFLSSNKIKLIFDYYNVRKYYVGNWNKIQSKSDAKSKFHSKQKLFDNYNQVRKHFEPEEANKIFF